MNLQEVDAQEAKVGAMLAELDRLQAEIKELLAKAKAAPPKQASLLVEECRRLVARKQELLPQAVALNTALMAALGEALAKKAN